MELIYMFAPSVTPFATTQAARRFRQEEVRGDFFLKDFTTELDMTSINVPFIMCK